MHRARTLVLSFGWLLVVATALLLPPAEGSNDGYRAPEQAGFSAEEAVPTHQSRPADCPSENDDPFRWTTFRGTESTMDSERIPVGAMVRAYDPTGLVVGCYEVILSGYYLMTVYGDSPETPERDGPEDGDRIAFTVDAHQAVPMGPDEPVWSVMGVRQVELNACTFPGDFDCDCRVTTIDLMLQEQSLEALTGRTGYYPPYDRDHDRDIDIEDLRTTAGQWHTTCQ